MVSKDLLRQLKSTEKEIENKQIILRKKKEEFENSIENDKQEIEKLNSIINEFKEKLEVQALTEFKDTQQKKLLGGIGIRETKKLNYLEDDALNWAKNKQLCIQLDKKAFEKIAKVQNLDFVSEETEVKVTFPKEIKLED